VQGGTVVEDTPEGEVNVESSSCDDWASQRDALTQAFGLT